MDDIPVPERPLPCCRPASSPRPSPHLSPVRQPEPCSPSPPAERAAAARAAAMASVTASVTASSEMMAQANDKYAELAPTSGALQGIKSQIDTGTQLVDSLQQMLEQAKDTVNTQKRLLHEAEDQAFAVAEIAAETCCLCLNNPTELCFTKCGHAISCVECVDKMYERKAASLTTVRTCGAPTAASGRPTSRCSRCEPAQPRLCQQSPSVSCVCVCV